MNMKMRFKQWGICLLHNVLLLLGVTLIAMIQYSFAKDVGTSGESFISVTIYELNAITFLIGTVLFIMFYYFMWKHWLKKDFINNFKSQKGWALVYIILTLISLFAIFIAYIVVIIFMTGLFATVDFPGEVMPYMSIAYMIIYPVVESIITHKKKNLP